MKFFKNKLVIIAIIITALIIARNLYAFGTNRKIIIVEDFMGYIVTPVQQFLYRATLETQNFMYSVTQSTQIKQQNDELTDQIDELRQQVRLIDDLKDENARLREMLDIKVKEFRFNLEAAEIASKSPGVWFDIFTIDKGTSNGLSRNRAVITNKGLVGYIMEVGTNWSKVLSITNSDNAVSAICIRTKDTGVVRGDIENKSICKMYHIPSEAEIVPGDMIETSGMGGIYPQGVFVGKVISIEMEPGGTSQTAIIEPAVDFRNINEVFIIMDEVE